MKRSIVPAALLLVVALASGCLFDSDDKDDVKKGSVTGKVTMIVTGEPVAGVKVMLVNKNAKIDTTDYSKSRAAFVDSAVTGADGAFVIDDIKPGNYGVVPMPVFGENSYKYSLAQNSVSDLTLNGETVTVNFIAEKKNNAGAEGGFTYKIFIKKDSRYKINGASSLRKYWVFFVPYYDGYLSASVISMNSDKYSHYIQQTETWGYTAVLWTEENYFKYTIVYETADTATDKTKDFYFGFPLSNTPAYSEWEMDIGAGTIIQTK